MPTKRILIGLGLALAIVTSGIAQADEEPLKVAIVDLDQALNSIEEGKAAREELARKMRESDAKLQPMVDKFKKMEEEFNSKKYVLSEEALYQKQIDLAELKAQIESKLRELQAKGKLDQERLVGPLRKKLIDIVREVSKSEGYTIVISRDSPGLIYSRESVDITDLVVERFNQKG